MKKIYIAAGCFWGTQAYYEKIKGIISTEVGYLNGGYLNVTYKEVCNSSGHVEVVKLVFDESLITDQEIFDYFIRIVDPFSLNRQGNDIGVQYRSGIYMEDSKNLEKYKNILNNWEKINGTSQIEVKKSLDYTPAEEEHQDYLLKNKNGYCHINLINIPKNLEKK